LNDVKNAIALAENSLGKDTNKPPTLKDGYQGNKPGDWTQIVRKKKKPSMRQRPALVIGPVVEESDLCSKTILSLLKNTALFGMMQLNTQCTVSKLDLIEIFLLPLSPSVICVADHWGNPSSLPLAIIPRYTQATAFCRTSSIHGGTLIFVNI
ncbi:hypothetical protein WA026_013191, partial [Henosepilachna vigintioctopunctata]